MTYYTDTGFNTATPRPTIIARIAAALELRKQRLALNSLTDTQLSDVGLTREEAAKEVAKSLWTHSA